jgi:hypothetical protein
VITPEESIVQRFAGLVSERICRRMIRQLQGEPATEMGPAQLKTLWDEVCIQVQGEESVMWEAYLDEIERRLEYEVTELSTLEREAVWLQTDEGFDWRYDLEDGDSDRTPPVVDEDLVRYIKAALLSQAADWSNAAISAQQEDDGWRSRD